MLNLIFVTASSLLKPVHPITSSSKTNKNCFSGSLLCKYQSYRYSEVLSTIKAGAPFFPNLFYDGYSNRDIRYCWKEQPNNYKESVSKSDDIHLPQFSIQDHLVTRTFQNLTTGLYSRLSCRFIFSRSIGFYVIQIYLPSTLIVVISWVSFWLSRDASPARVSLGVTTVLTMTTLMTTTNAAMPKVSYIKSIDLYLGVCFIMVFASLLEYAAVGYLNKRIRMKGEKKALLTSATTTYPLNPRKRLGTYSDYTKFPSKQHDPPTRAESFSAVSVKSSKEGSVISTPQSFVSGTPSHPPKYPHLECDCDLESQRSFVKNVEKRKPKQQHVQMVTPSAIDKYSRVIFPVLFIVFNAMYWSISYHLSSHQASTYIYESLKDAINPLKDDCKLQ